MKITSFNPMIVTAKQPECQKLFEELGFEQRHDKASGVRDDIHTIRMKDANGFHVDISSVPGLERDLTYIRMNVDNLDEACELLKAHGFQPNEGSRAITDSAHSVLMVSPSGFAIDVVKHIKDHD